MRRVDCSCHESTIKSFEERKEPKPPLLNVPLLHENHLCPPLQQPRCTLTPCIRLTVYYITRGERLYISSITQPHKVCVSRSKPQPEKSLIDCANLLPLRQRHVCSMITKRSTAGRSMQKGALSAGVPPDGPPPSPSPKPVSLTKW